MPNPWHRTAYRLVTNMIVEQIVVHPDELAAIVRGEVPEVRVAEDGGALVVNGTPFRHRDDLPDGVPDYAHEQGWTAWEAEWPLEDFARGLR